jgi:low molecular weight protein-tyrosine phosphatase
MLSLARARLGRQAAGQNGRVRVCFVCSGNICRSPTAEVVFAALLRDAGVDDVTVDSAGTGDWHVGDDMDRRARATLVEHGYDHPRHEAKQFTPADFDSRDLVVALDAGHVRYLRELASAADDPDDARAKIVLLRSFDPDADPADLDVPDPYYGGAEGFVEVLQQIERAGAGLLASVRQQTLSPPS